MNITNKKVTEIKTVSDFDNIVLNTKNTHDKKFIFVDFYATWCGPCMRIAPDIEDMAARYSDVFFVKVDIDQASELAEMYDVTRLPTFMIFDVGCLKSPYKPIIGANKSDIETRLKSLTAKAPAILSEF
jgi:thioredoxin